MTRAWFGGTDRLLPEVEHWPGADWAAWQRATSAGRGPFHRAHRCNSAYSVRKLRGGYARWLRYLDDAGQLDPDRPPGDRVTPERLDGYFEHLRARGNADATLVGRFAELRDALRMMQPGTDFRWVAKPGGRSIRQLLPMRTRVIAPIDSAVLLAWAEALFAEGLASPVRRTRCTLVRDAAIIGLLADRAPRLRALSGLRLQDSLKRTDGGWLLRQHGRLTKMGAPLFIPVSDRVGHMLDRYVAVERGELLGPCEDRLAWARFGGALTREGIVAMVKKHSRRRFGRPFGPHYFRHCLATTVAAELSGHPLDGSTLLGHSNPKTTLKSYVHATMAATAQRHAGLLERLRG